MVDAEVTDIAGGVVAIHNVPGESDVGAVPVGHLEVADNLLGICECFALKCGNEIKCMCMFIRC